MFNQCVHSSLYMNEFNVFIFWNICVHFSLYMNKFNIFKVRGIVFLQIVVDNYLSCEAVAKLLY